MKGVSACFMVVHIIRNCYLCVINMQACNVHVHVHVHFLLHVHMHVFEVTLGVCLYTCMCIGKPSYRTEVYV